MSFQLNCPNCGKRAVTEFSFKCEYMERPEADADFKEWGDYIFLRKNKKGTQTEWWFHRSGCKSWFLVERDTTNNTDHKSIWYKDLKDKDIAPHDSQKNECSIRWLNSEFLNLMERVEMFI